MSGAAPKKPAPGAFMSWVVENDLVVDARSFDWEPHRYLVPIYEDDAPEIVLMKGAQVGATIWLLLRLLWWVTEHTLKAGLYFPTAEGVQKLSKDRLSKLIDQNPCLRGKLSPGGTLSLKQFGGSSLYLQHIGGTASKDSTPLDVLAFDEVRLVESRDVNQAEERVSHSPYQVKYYASTAGVPSCFPAETRILLRDRQTGDVLARPICELVRAFAQYDALSYDPLTQRLAWRHITGAIARGVRPMVRLRLWGGHEIRCTPDHRFAQASPETPALEWTEAQELLVAERPLVGAAPTRSGILVARYVPAEGCRPPSLSRADAVLPDLAQVGVAAVVPDGEDPAYDLEIEEAPWFVLADSMALAHNSDIHARFLRTDQHWFHTKCGCADGIVMPLVFPDCVAVTPTEVYYRCPRCGFRIRDPQNGRFVPHNPGAPVRGYQIHQMLSRYVSPRQVWQNFLETDNKQEFFNAKLGVPYVDPRNIGLTADELDACTTDAIAWEKPTTRADGSIDGRMCMGIDQMGGFNYVTILQQTPVGRRLVRLEVVENDDPFRRCYELMNEYRIDVCVVDALPNFNEAIRFSHAFPRKVWCAFWSPNAVDMVQWSDRKKQPMPTKRSSPETKTPWSVKLNKFSAMEHALRQFQNRRVLVPRPDGYEQVMRDRHGFLGPVNLYRHWRDHMTSVIRQKREVIQRTEDKKAIHTGNYIYEWIYTRGDPHALDSVTYAVFAAERLPKKISFALG